MPELRVTETSPTLAVAFVDTEKGTSGNSRNLGEIGHPLETGQVAWDQCECEPIDAQGNTVKNPEHAKGVRIRLQGR